MARRIAHVCAFGEAMQAAEVSAERKLHSYLEAVAVMSALLREARFWPGNRETLRTRWHVLH